MIVVDGAPPGITALAEAINALSESLFGSPLRAGHEMPLWQALTVMTGPWRQKADPDLLQKVAAAWRQVRGWVVWDEHFRRLVWLTDYEWTRMRKELGYR